MISVIVISKTVRASETFCRSVAVSLREVGLGKSKDWIRCRATSQKFVQMFECVSSFIIEDVLTYYTRLSFACGVELLETYEQHKASPFMYHITQTTESTYEVSMKGLYSERWVRTEQRFSRMYKVLSKFSKSSRLSLCIAARKLAENWRPLPENGNLNLL